VQLQRYSSSDGIWTTIQTITEAEDADEDVVHVCFDVPAEERSRTSSQWRLFVPATENAAEAYSEVISVTTRNIEKYSLSARNACVYRIDEDGSGTMIYSKESKTEVAQASTTKLMTAVLLLESGLLDTTTTISYHAAETPWGSGKLEAGDVYNTKDLLYAMLLPSSNDAATAVAERVGGTEGAFVQRMNAKAEKMGWTQTHFRNPHGLDADGHYTTALELAKLTAYAYTFPEIRDCWGTQWKTIRSLKYGNKWTLWSTNAIFGYISSFLGGKTGTEDNAGCCFTGVYEYEGTAYVTVVLGSGYGFSRWTDTKKLHSYIRNYATSSY
jgi:D-alanyl-D-alanine carboxypeptidase (penicillin-binding protein 5/6)